MKHLSKIMSGLALLALASCASDEPGMTGGDDNKPADGIYSSIKFKMPASVRSTDMEGNEEGQESENNVGSIMVLITEKGTGENEYKYITYALNDAPITGTTNSTHTIVFQDKEKLFDKAGSTVYLFAFCNPSEALVTKIAGTLNIDTGEYENALPEGTDISTLVCDSDIESTWSKNGFLMTSIDITSKDLPDAETLKTYNTPANAFPLGTIEVVRTCSRFDFRDASPAGTDPLTYTIVDNDKADKPKVADIKLTRVALFNMRNQFFYLPRTLSGTTTKVCPGYDGLDADGIYVLTPDARTFTYGMPASIDAAATDDSGLDFVSLDVILGNAQDKDEGWGNSINPAVDKEGYHIWTYSTENAWGPDDTPVFAGTTGFVFEAEILVPDGFGNKDGEGNPVTMYLYNNRLYASANAIKAAVAMTPVSNIATAYKQGFTENADGTITPKSDEELRNLGFEVYHPDGGKYFCYYYAPNIHNNDNDITAFGIMEYATVRNNIYKLAVTKIEKFGSFTPEPLDQWDSYFTLDVKVRNWVVRVNNYEF